MNATRSFGKIVGTFLGICASFISIIDLPWYLGGLLGLFIGQVFDRFQPQEHDDSAHPNDAEPSSERASHTDHQDATDDAPATKTSGQPSTADGAADTDPTAPEPEAPLADPKPTHEQAQAPSDTPKNDTSTTSDASQLNELSQAFFNATFTILGRVAKEDGRVSKNEIAFAQSIMQRMNLNEPQKVQAINLFNQGKNPETDLTPLLDNFSKAIGRRLSLANVLVDIQLQGALTDDPDLGRVQPTIDGVCQALNIKPEQQSQLAIRARAFIIIRRDQISLDEQHSDFAYDILGVDQDTDDQKLKNAYRRLLNQYHPDKLISSGFPEAMTPLVKEQTQFVKSAYEIIRQIRQENNHQE